MRTRATITAVVAVAGMAAAASAQDSVSDLPGTGQGDGLVPWDATQQCAAYVVDLVPFESSTGAQFAIAPLVKSSKNATDFFSSLVGAQGVSALDILSDGFNQPEYFIWDQPGFGVNFADTANGVPNLTPDLAQPQAEGRVRQFGAMFGEFGTTDAGAGYEAAIGAIVNYDEADPNRLYVTRYNAALNGASPTENRAAMGYGSIDSNGNLYFRADDFGPTGPNPIVGNNIFRVDLAARDCDTLNVIDNAGGADANATDWVVQNSGTTHSVPGNLEASVAGRPVYIGANFNTQNVRESAPVSTTADTSHLADPAGDQRGAISTYRRDVLGNGGVGTANMLQKVNSGDTNAVTLWSVDANGVPVGSPVGFTLPASPIGDPTTGFVLGSGNGEYDHYHSQVPFRGGVGQTDVGETLGGEPLFLGVTYTPNAPQNVDPFNAIVVGRFDPSDPTGSVEYALAGYIALDGNSGVAEGKPVLDGDGNVIGEMVDLFALTQDQPGPSMSGAAFDGAGNVWFIGIVDYNLDPDGEPDIRTTLLRSVYTELDGGGFGYELEKVIAFGDIFTGANSATDYRIGPMQIVDGDSVNSGTFWSGNVKQEVAPTAQRGALTPADAASTAGVVVSAGILYDVDGDGDFNFPGDTDPDSADEGYNVLLYVAPAAGAPCPEDLDGNNAVDATDLGILIAAWGSPTMNPAADLTGDGNVDATDLGVLIAGWGPCS